MTKKINDDLISRIICYLRFPMTVGVVFIHNDYSKNGLCIHGESYGLNCPEWYYYFVTFFSDVLPRLCVPMFFFFSGFLFFYHSGFNKCIYENKIKKRVKTLFVPYLLWNVVAILFNLVYKLPFLSSVFPNASEIQLSLNRIFNTFFANNGNRGIFVSPITDPLDALDGNIYPIDFPLWFVRDLMFVIILTPLLYWLIIRFKQWFIVILGCFYFIYQPIFMNEGGWSVQLSQALFFFSWGAYYSINNINFISNMREYRFIPLVYILVAVVDTFTKEMSFNTFVHNFGIIVGAITLVIVVAEILVRTNTKINKRLSESSFFIFALHALLLNNFGKFLLLALHLPDNVITMLSLYLLVPILTIALCFITYLFFSHCMPKLCSLLTGGR